MWLFGDATAGLVGPSRKFNWSSVITDSVEDDAIEGLERSPGEHPAVRANELALVLSPRSLLLKSILG